MNASDYVASHGKADVTLLLQMWADGATAAEIAERFGVSVSTARKWRVRYGLPPRDGTHEYEPPSPEDDAASASGLALSPWVEQRARECRERHYAERMNETDECARAKAALWRARCLKY